VATKKKAPAKSAAKGRKPAARARTKPVAKATPKSRSERSLPADPATQYARDVIAGSERSLAGRLVKLACERHLRDLKEGKARGLTFDVEAAQHAIDFFGFLTLAEGEHAGKPFQLQPFQQFIVGCLFGWKGSDGYRRFRTAYVEQGKGNGKSPLAGGIGLYCLLADNEPGAEVYSAATTRDQAGILFKDARNMVNASPSLTKRLDGGVGLHNLADLKSNSFFRPVSSENRGLDGKRVHCALIDELHEHPTDLVVNKMRAGTKGRRQALVFEITNSGHDRTSVCWHHHEYSVQVLKAKTPEDAGFNDSWFAYVCGLDACAAHHVEGKTQPVEGCEHCDDWRDEKTWQKANPNLGVSVTVKYLREQVAEAVGMPTKEGIVKRLNFCVWCESETAWLSADLWSKGAGPIDVTALTRRVCFGGLDVASKIDVAACVYAFPDFPADGDVSLLCRFWIPEATAKARQTADGVPWLKWAEAGFVTLTEGESIDQDRIEAAVKKDAETYRLKELAFDSWNASMLASHLMQHGVTVFEFCQNMRNFNEPTKHFEALLREGHLKHGDNPVLRWMAGNVMVLADRNNNVRPVKPSDSSSKKVDGVTGAVMAVGRMMLAPPSEGESVYDTRRPLLL
jgi:phage terminase large subunit-like protein